MTHRYIVIGPSGPLPWTIAQSPKRAVERFLPRLPTVWEVAMREGYRVDRLMVKTDGINRVASVA